MDIGAFCKEVCPPRATILGAIGGGLSGKFLGVSPLQGAVYATASSVAYRVAYKINGAIRNAFFDKACDFGIDRDFNNLSMPPVAIANVYLGYIAGNKALSSLGRQIAFGTAVQISFSSAVTGFFAGLLIDCIRSRIGN